MKSNSRSSTSQRVRAAGPAARLESGSPVSRVGIRNASATVRVLARGTTTLVLLVAAGAAACSPSGDAQEPVTPVAASAASASTSGAPHDATELAWGPAPEMFPSGAELALVHGNPSEAGAVFTLRLRMPNGYVFPPHFHPEDEHVTVMQGKFLVGLGNVVDEASAVASLQRGGFITAPKMHNHWAIARGVTVVQVHGIGPFQTTFVDESGNALPE